MPEIIKDLVCTGCSMLCDDIIVELEKGKILKTHHVCARGYGRYYQVNFNYRIFRPILRMDGKEEEVSYERAISETINLLKTARNPFFYGWASATSEAQQKGIQLAQKYKGMIGSAATFSIGRAIQQFLQKNIEVPSLKSIKDNADVLLFWGANPTASHIRLLSRYALFARGANTDRGMEDKVAITVDIRNTDMRKFSQSFWRIDPGKDRFLLEGLTKIIEGKALTEDQIANIPRKELYDVANTIKDARFGVIFFGNGYGKTSENMASLFHFLDVLKQKGVQFAAIPLDGGYNAIGFNINLKKVVGLELIADFRQDPVVQNQDLFISMLRKGEIDLLVNLGADPISNCPFSISKLIAQIPIVSIDFQQTPTAKLSNVVIPTMIPGVESAGTAYRLDFTPITLKKFLAAPNGIHSDEDIISALLKNA
ncbi:MAG TPA: formylmethanofuran dehydrogenase subunit B [Candidatus Deferrimicrobium sp.]|nr:formylmethanofuran dehydrogenase subunit B [Candidatus Deferrimicrobium sp.]